MQPLNYTIPGPLTGHGHAFADYLKRLGYAPTSIGLRLNLLRHFSRWLEDRSINLDECDDARLSDYCRQRSVTHTDMASPGKIAPMITFLRQAGLIADEAPPPPLTRNRRDELLDNWSTYLLEERGLCPVTVDYNRRFATPFILECLPDGDASTLAPEPVCEFVSTHLPQRSSNEAFKTVTALRSLLKYLHSSGQLTEPLDHLILRPRTYRDTTIARGLPADDIDTLLHTVSTDTRVGKRDRAIFLLLARLGLRAGEVAALTLDDLDWTQATIRIHGKGGYIDRMPLPADVGTAITDYLRVPKDPAMTGRVLFHSARAPYRPITSEIVKSVIQNAARTAGIGPIGAHRLRHTLATTTINSGASLEEVAQLLRHRHLTSTMIYAKVDLTRLTLITRPWPHTATTGKES